jgi:hypothetical protein
VIDCGQTHVLDDEVRRAIGGRRPDLVDAVKGMTFGEITECVALDAK